MQTAGKAREAAGEKAAELTFENTWLEQFIPQREVRWVFYVAALFMLIAIATWVVMKLKDFSGPGLGSVDHLTEFEDLYDRGAFSDEEMARLKESIHSNLTPDANGTTKTDSAADNPDGELNETNAGESGPDEGKHSNESFEIKKPR